MSSAAGSAGSSEPSSSLTAIRSAWKTRFAGWPVAEARRRGDRGLDRVDELAGALERLLAPAADDRPRDLPRVALLAVVA